MVDTSNIRDHLRTAHHRPGNSPADGQSRMALALSVEQHRTVFPEAEFQQLKASIDKMGECLGAAQDAARTITQSGMHPPLDVSEIVCMIVSQLDCSSREGRAALATLARCKIFHDHALDALWREQETIFNLIACMPADVWGIGPDLHAVCGNTLCSGPTGI
ncbi:hypothetical protein C8R45DRAFT_1095368 [Mycena sanguinolenta]|nr:hypothetical protein C8R45DRAFT_1095368 [Mycena sanguinolenta]